MKMAFTIEHGYAEPSQNLLGIPRWGIYPFYTMEDFTKIIEQKKWLISQNLKMDGREHGTIHPLYIH